MNISCQNCFARLQVDDAKIPSRSFTVRCPNCKRMVEAQRVESPPDHSGLGLGKSPATEAARFERPMPAPPFRGASEQALSQPGARVDANLGNVENAAKFLVELLHRNGISDDRKARRKDDRRRLLLCATLATRETIAGLLAANGYEVFVAENTTQAVESMREERMDIVILDPAFDPVEQGYAFVTREVNTLRPADRRRLFFVSFSPAVRTFDLHTAFLNNVNLVVHPSDIEQLPRVLERAMRDFNELYREFNSVTRMSAI